jgi:hypothetical protein
MNLTYLTAQLQQAGWKNIGPNIHMDLQFDLVGERNFTLTKWNILIKTLPMLDAPTVSVWQSNFKAISEKSKHWFWGKCFLLCLITQQVAPDIAAASTSDTVTVMDRYLEMLIRDHRGGGGRVLIADDTSKQVYGEVPAIPYDSHKYTQSVKEILLNALVQK